VTRSSALVLAHGFTQTARSWATTKQLLVDEGASADALRVIDMPGHGAAADVRSDLWESAERLVHSGGHGTYVGYSMGGRVALHAALSHPGQVERLVLIGATPGIIDDDERRSRRNTDERLADHIEDVGVNTFIDEWLANPLFAGLTPENAMRGDRLRNTAAGLASSLRLAGTGTQEPLWDRLADIECPVLLVAGADDPKFRAIAEKMDERLANATISVIDRSGHSVHLERPAETVRAIAAWMRR
jgi:2-succinyl-6-hydroxy-2,4-cyclohexadiene-1-carboxylate synthase